MNDKSIQRGSEADMSSKNQLTHKVKASKSAVNVSDAINNDSDDDNDVQSAAHTGLAVQARKCKLHNICLQ